MHLSLSQDCVATDKSTTCSHVQVIKTKGCWGNAQHCFQKQLTHLHTAACMQYLANNFGPPSMTATPTGALERTHINQTTETAHTNNAS